MGDLTRALQRAFLAVLFWTAMGVFFAGQIMALNRGVSWGDALSLTMPRWYVWGILTPAIFWADKRIGEGRSLAARVACHLPLGIAWTCLSILIRLVTRPLRGSPWPVSLGRSFSIRLARSPKRIRRPHGG